MDNNLTYLEQLAQQGGGGLAGTQYIFVAADGTPVENALELQAAYDQAKTMSPAADNRITVIAAPGEYALNGLFTMDTQYIDLVSLTGNRDVIFDRADIVGDPFDFDPYYAYYESELVSSIGECMLVSADNVFVKGIKGKLRQSPNWDNSLGEGEDYILPIQIGNNLSGLVMENCEGGILSFGGDITFGNNPIEVSGTFTNCVGGIGSFGYYSTASGTFTDCVGGDYSFGGDGGIASGTFTDCVGGDGSFGYYGTANGTFTNCQGGDGSFGSDGTASGTFTNCQGSFDSFGGYGTASGTFTNCVGGDYSFGVYGTASGTFTNCVGGDYSFGVYSIASGVFTDCVGGDSSFGHYGTASGTFTDCVGGDGSFGYYGTANGTFTNCQGGNGSFGGNDGEPGTLDGFLYFCRKTAGDFQTLTATGLIRASVDGSNTFIATLDA